MLLGLLCIQILREFCENPTQEDREWFPDYVDKPWLEILDFAMRNFKDESFILQFYLPS